MSANSGTNPVGWFEIYVDDMPRAQAFYEAVFGTPFTQLDTPGQPPGMEMWAFPRHQNAMGITGALVKMPGLDAGGHNVLVYFMCTDCAVEAEGRAIRRAPREGKNVHRPVRLHRAGDGYRRQHDRPAFDAVGGASA
jgi:predicted enzyme related to lactoylglutathione lyase